MNDLLFSCAEDLSQAETPICATDYGHAVKIILSKTPVLSAGNVPNANEFNDAYNAGQIVIISGFTNFKREKVGETELSGEELESGVRELLDNEYSLTGRIKRLDNAVLRLTEVLNFYKILYLYYITDHDYCFGGYKCEPRVSLITQNVTPLYVDFQFNFYATGADYSAQDASYNEVPGLYSFLVYEDDKRIYTEDEKVIIF